MLPGVRIRKQDGNTGVVRPSNDGVLAIIAPSAAGTRNVPATHTRKTLAYAQFSDGPLVDEAAYCMGTSGKPSLLIRPTTSTPASYVGLTTTGGGTSAITQGATDPADDYNVIVTFKTAGTRGVLGITYTYSLDGGESTSETTALGTATTLTIPNSGVSFNLGAGTVLLGETITCTTKCARMNNVDLLASLEALRLSKAPWDMVLIHGEADVTMAQTVNDWLVALETRGVYKGAILSVRFPNAGETEAAYRDALSTQFGGFSASTGIELVIGADGAFNPQPKSGLLLKRPTSMFVAARAMAIDIATDPALVDDGAVNGASITDTQGNPICHDESLFPGLDDQRFTVLRTFDDPDSPQGVFIDNANVFSANGSDFVYLQHTRVMNRACRIAFQRLTRKLSKGVRKDTSGHILEVEAKSIEGDVQALYNGQLVRSTPVRCTDARLALTRDDDLSSNAGATLTGDVEVVSLAYIKGFDLTAKFVKSIAVSAAA